MAFNKEKKAKKSLSNYLALYFVAGLRIELRTS